MQICKVDSFNIILLFFLAVSRCSDNTKTAYEQQSYPQKYIAVIAGFRACGIGFISFCRLCLLRSCFYLKISTALAVVVDNGQGVLADKTNADILKEKKHLESELQKCLVRSEQVSELYIKCYEDKDSLQVCGISGTAESCKTAQLPGGNPKRRRRRVCTECVTGITKKEQDQLPAHTYQRDTNVGKKKSSVLIQLSGWL